jgi:3-hydroxybutyrate dehydrogenase
VQAQAQELAKYNVKVLTSTADLRQPQRIREMMAQAQSDMGDVDILVNNAGIQHVSPVHEFQEDKWDDLIAVRPWSFAWQGLSGTANEYTR